MKENNFIVCFRNLAAGCLIVAVFIASSTAALAATPAENKSAAGELVVSGRSGDGGNTPFAMLNGNPAYTGRTFFSASTIATSENNGATVKLGKLGYVNVAPNSILNLSFDENSISGNLSAGQVKVFSGKGIAVKIQTANRLVANDAAQANVFSVDVRAGATNAVAEIGSVSLFDGSGAAVPAANTQRQTDTSDDNNSSLVPLIVLGGLVAAAVIYAVTNGNNNNSNPPSLVGSSTVSPSR